MPATGALAVVSELLPRRPRATGTVDVDVDVMAGRDLVPTDLSVLREILCRRDPELAGAVDAIDDRPLASQQRQRIRRAVVDEMCDLPSGDGRRALELQELLTRLGEV